MSAATASNCCSSIERIDIQRIVSRPLTPRLVSLKVTARRRRASQLAGAALIHQRLT